MKKNNKERNADVIPFTGRWSEKKLLAELRRQMREVHGSASVQAVFSGLLKASGWTRDELIDALCSEITSMVEGSR